MRKTVFITGATSGIGEACARKFAQGGYNLIITARRAEKLAEIKAQLEAEGAKVKTLTFDVRDAQAAQAAVESLDEEWQKIDVLINNVGGTIWARPIAEYQPDQIEKEIRRSLFPTLWGCRAALPWMLKQGKGSIVNISSVATAGVNRVPYSAAKGGVNALTRSIAMEYSGSGIRINAVAPGGTEAPPRLTPRNEEQPSEQEKAWYQQVVDQTVASSLLHRYGTLAEQANAILFLASDEASYITGVTLPVAGGDLG